MASDPSYKELHYGKLRKPNHPHAVDKAPTVSGRVWVNYRSWQCSCGAKGREYLDSVSHYWLVYLWERHCQRKHRHIGR